MLVDRKMRFFNIIINVTNIAFPFLFSDDFKNTSIFSSSNTFTIKSRQINSNDIGLLRYVRHVKYVGGILSSSVN